MCSLFIRHARASEVLDIIKKQQRVFILAKTWQVGMDGPNINLSFHKMLVDQRNEDDLPNLLDLGTCALHTIHRAFQTGATGTHWNLDKYLFKDSPARSEDFVSYTGCTIIRTNNKSI